MLTTLKNALIERGSIIMATFITAGFALYRMFNTTFTWTFFFDEFISKALSFLSSIKVSLFSCCLSKSKGEKMLEFAERLEAGYNMISNIDPHNLSEMDAFRRIKNTYKDILLKLN